MSFLIGFTSDETEAKAEVFTSKNGQKKNFRHKKLRFMVCGIKSVRVVVLFFSLHFEIVLVLVEVLHFWSRVM